MSRFHVGQLVWIGWTPDRTCADRRARQYRCTVGTLKSGPYPPGYQGRFLYRSPDISWNVEVDGAVVNAAEYLLTPFDDPGERVIDFERLLETTE